MNACSGARCLSDAPGRCGIGSATTRPAGLRELLIDPAEKLPAERQVSTITTGDIARTAGVSGGVLYTYLADKNELLGAALVRGTRPNSSGSTVDRTESARDGTRSLHDGAGRGGVLSQVGRYQQIVDC